MTTPPEEPDVPQSGSTPPPPPAPVPPAAANPLGDINNPFANGVAGLKAAPLSQKLGLAMGVLGVLTFIAAFLPWASISIDMAGFSQSESVSGTGDGNDGVLTLLLGLIAGGFGVAYVLKGILGKVAAIVSAVAGAIITLIAIIDIADISDAGGAFEGFGGLDVSVGIGLWLTLLFGIGFIAAGALSLIKKD